MLTTQDFTKLRAMFGELLETNNDVLKREIRDEMQHTEARLLYRMDSLRLEIVGDVGEIINEGILPQLNDQRGFKLPKHRA